MGSFNDEFPSNYYTTDDVGDGVLTVTIKDVDSAVFGEGSQAKKSLIISVRDSKKQVKLPRAEGKFLATTFGDEMNDWIGRKIVLFATTAKFGGQTYDVVRIHEKKTQAAQTSRASAPPPPPPRDPGSDDDAGDEVPY